jgi:hypothetical protein
MGTPLEAMERELTASPHKVLILAGAGIALATDDSPCASWPGLLKDGVERCRQRCLSLSSGWFRITETMIGENKAAELIQAASRIEKELRAFQPGEYAAWLNESIGKLKLKDRRTIDALVRWQVRIATTNYDNLFEAASNLPTVIWSQGELALAFLRGDRSGILHLHGHYTFPETVVFGTETYSDICCDPPAQNALRSALARDTVVFVGCGAGVDDPNFAGLMKWSKDALKNCLHTHYLLVREGDMATSTEKYEGLRVTAVVYGREYSDLAGFLETVADRARPQSRTSSAFAVLTSKQNDFELRRLDLAAEKKMRTSEFVRRNFELARELWLAGGRRTAALQMDWVLTAKGNELTNAERTDLTLEAVEYLLQDGLDFQATVLLGTIENLIPDTSRDSERLSRFRSLVTKCLIARASLDKAFQVIESGLEFAPPRERARLHAERAELDLLSGNLQRAEQDVRPEVNKW